MTNVVISIGSNINAHINIDKALQLLRNHVEIIAMAPRLTTSPIGITQQPPFVNSAVEVLTNLPMEKLNLLLKEIEDKLGRDRSRPKFGPREIDLDVMIWNNDIVDDDYYDRPFLQELHLNLKPC